MEEPHVHVVVMTLGKANLTDMRAIVPDLLVLNSTNGFDPAETVRHLLYNTSLSFHKMCGQRKFDAAPGFFETWGTLACFVTRVRAVAYPPEQILQPQR